MPVFIYCHGAHIADDMWYFEMFLYHKSSMDGTSSYSRISGLGFSQKATKMVLTCILSAISHLSGWVVPPMGEFDSLLGERESLKILLFCFVGEFGMFQILYIQ